MKYSYRARTTSGDMDSGQLEATNDREALRLLAQRGLAVMELRLVASSSKTKGRIRTNDVLRLFEELVTLLAAGVTLSDALDSLADDQHAPVLAVEIEAINRKLHQGSSFADALRASKVPVPEYAHQLAAAGELSGKLAESLGQAVEQMQFDENVRSESKSALVYPAVLVFSGIAAVILVFALVVPKFTNLLETSSDLPWLAETVLRTGLMVNDYYPAIIISAILVGIICRSLWAKPAVRRRILNRLSTLPLIGTWMVESETGRWASILAALLRSGVPLMDSLSLANKAITVPSRIRKLEAAKVAVQGGQPLSAALKDQNALLPTAYNILRVGERAGELPAMLGSLAALYEKSSRDRLKRLLVLIEPLAIMVIGGVIGCIMLGVVLAITSSADIPL